MENNIKNLILDMDGVLWHGETPVPGLFEFFEALNDLNINFVLATNNARKTAVQYTEKLARFNVEIPPEKILTSAETTATFLSQRYSPGTKVYIIGDKGLHDAMAAKDFINIEPDDVKNGQSAALIVVGFTPYTYYKELAMGALLVQRGAAFYGTNPDPSFPSELGPLPGAGALLALITASTSVKPITIGKPEKHVFVEAVRRLNSLKSETAMVGDRLTTDIAGAQASGLHTILLLSGISTLEDVQNSQIKPDYIFEDIQELTSKLKSRGKITV